LAITGKRIGQTIRDIKKYNAIISIRVLASGADKAKIINKNNLLLNL